MSDDAATPAPRKRRWFRFSLRFLLVLVVIVAVPLAWKVNRVRNQRLVVVEVEALGGRITLAHESGVLSGRAAEAPGPKWLRKILGDSYFAEVIQIDVRQTAVSDEVLARFSTLTDLKYLVLDANKVTDAGFEQIATLPHLAELALYSDQMTDTNLRHLQNAAGLIDLCLSGEKITDAGLRHIGKLTQLRCLRLQASMVTDRGLVELYGMRNLCEMELGDTSVTPEGVERLRKALPKCQISVTTN